MAEGNKLKQGETLYTAFDEYKIKCLVGEGANGNVYSATNTDGEHVAIKAINVTVVGREKIKRFKNEISFCQRSESKNIIKVLDVGMHDSGRVTFYVMPLYQETLRARMKRGIGPDEAILLFDSILAGLEYAHKNGIYHRDLKPENILINESNNECVIADFGIAHFPTEEMITDVSTRLGERLANFQYAAPEQKMKGLLVDGRADVFAAGLILNEMLTGQLMGGSDYKRIGDIYNDYYYLDTIVEELYKQDPSSRLYPVKRIREELQARISIAHSEEEKRNLNRLLEEHEHNTDTFIRVPVPELVGAEVENMNLILELDSEVSPEWFSQFKNGAYGHTSLLGAGPEYFTMQSANKLSIGINNVGRDSINTIIIHFKEWLAPTTALYNNEMDRRYNEKKRKEREELEKRIKEKERNIELNNYVQSLI